MALKNPQINMKQIILICCMPILFLLEVMAYGIITDLLNQKNDIAVLIGVLSICADLFLNYLLIQFIIKQFKTK